MCTCGGRRGVHVEVETVFVVGLEKGRKFAERGQLASTESEVQVQSRLGADGRQTVTQTHSRPGRHAARGAEAVSAQGRRRVRHP